MTIKIKFKKLTSNWIKQYCERGRNSCENPSNFIAAENNKSYISMEAIIPITIIDLIFKRQLKCFAKL